MKTNLINQLKRHEGIKLKAYQCTAGKWTIGVGRNVQDNGISEDEALYLLDNDVVRCSAEVYRGMPWTENLDYCRFAVLVNMCFTLGFAGLTRFKKMIAACEAKDFDTAAKEMLDSKWANQVGNRAVELSEQMRTGKWRLV